MSTDLFSDDLTTFELHDRASGLDFCGHLRRDRRVHVFTGESGAGRTVLFRALRGAFTGLSEIWDPGYAIGTFLGAATREALTGHFIRESKLSLPVGRFGDMPVPAAVDTGPWRRTTPVTSSRTPPRLPGHGRPVVAVKRFFPSALQHTLDGHVPLPGTVWETFGAYLTGPLLGVNDQHEADAALTPWLARRGLLDPGFETDGTPPSRRFELRCLLDLMLDFDPARYSRVYREARGGDVQRQPDIVAKEDDLTIMGVPLGSLPSGDAALLRLFHGIVGGIAAWEALRGEADLRNSPAVIVIDDIDTFLPEGMQVRLVGFLTEAFPRAHFFVTSRSSALLRGVPAESVITLVRVGRRVTVQTP